MAHIYSAPKEITQPEFNWNDYEQYKKDCEAYKENLKAFLLERKKGKEVGEIIQFQVADGYAQYMIASMKPLELVHIELDDAYSFQYAHLLTVTEVNALLEQKKALAELFAKKG